VDGVFGEMDSEDGGQQPRHWHDRDGAAFHSANGRQLDDSSSD